jgi:hypothetical protein
LGQFKNISGNAVHAISIPVDTGVRDFSFSPDGSALAVVDFHGDILLWALRTEATFREFYDTALLKGQLTLSKPMIQFALPPDLNPCSIQFLDLLNGEKSAPYTPLLLVGSSYNRRLNLIDIGLGTVWQEIVLPSIGSENMPAQNFAMSYNKDKQFLTIGDTLSNSIFYLHLSSPPLVFDTTKSQSDYLGWVAAANCTDTSCQRPNGTLPSFDYVTEIPFPAQFRLQTLAVTTSMEACLDVFTAHSSGFTMFSPSDDEILPANYMEASCASLTSVVHPVLDRVVDLKAPTPSRTPSPRDTSRGSSSASTRGFAKVVVKNEVLETSTERKTMDQDIPPNDTGETGIGILDAISAESVSLSADAEKSPSAPRRDKRFASITKDIDVLLNQALEQQCTSSCF